MAPSDSKIPKMKSDKPVLQVISLGLSTISQGVTRLFKSVVDIARCIHDIHDTLLKDKRTKGHEVAVTHPNGGGSKTFIKGTTRLDFYEGTVTYPDGSQELLLRNLKEHGQTHMSSIYIKTDSEIKVNFDGHGEFSIRDFLQEVVDFQVVYITTTLSTAISLTAWTKDTSYLATAKLGTGTSSRVFTRTEVSQYLSLGSLSKTTASSGARWKLMQVLFHSSVAISETVTIVFASGTSANYNTILYTGVLSAQSNSQYQPDSEIIGLSGDEITVTCTNANLTGTIYATIILEQI